MFYGSVRAPKKNSCGQMSVLVHFPGCDFNPAPAEKVVNLRDFEDGPLDFEQRFAFEDAGSSLPNTVVTVIDESGDDYLGEVAKEGDKVKIEFPRDGYYYITYEADGYVAPDEYVIVEHRKIVEANRSKKFFTPRSIEVRYQHAEEGKFATTSQTKVLSDFSGSRQIGISDCMFVNALSKDGSQFAFNIKYHKYVAGANANGCLKADVPFEEIIDVPLGVKYRRGSSIPVQEGDAFLFKENKNGKDSFTKVEIVKIL